jgi:hypothetical protein
LDTDQHEAVELNNGDVVSINDDATLWLAYEMGLIGEDQLLRIGFTKEDIQEYNSFNKGDTKMKSGDHVYVRMRNTISVFKVVGDNGNGGRVLQFVIKCPDDAAAEIVMNDLGSKALR